MKKLFILALFSFAALFVNAAAVVWKYTPSMTVDPAKSAVKLVAWSGETATDCQILTTLEGTHYFAAVDSAEIYSIIPSDSSDNLSFTVRLYSFDADDKEILTEESAKVAFDELYEKNAIFFDAATTPNPTAYDFAGVIPEPTSAMMLVLGLATLALKRRV